MAKSKIRLEEFSFKGTDPLANEHRDIADWVKASLASGSEARYHQLVDMKTHPVGVKILQGDSTQSVRYIRAAVAQVRHWDKLVEQLRNTAENETQRINVHWLPGWTEMWERRSQTAIVIKSLMRRTLPFNEHDLRELVDWCNDAESLHPWHYPLSYLVRALERFAHGNPIEGDFLRALGEFALLLRSSYGSYNKEVSKLATSVEQLCVTMDAKDVGDEHSRYEPSTLPPTPEMAGQTNVLIELKQYFGMLPSELLPSPTKVVGPDKFPLTENSPLAKEHSLLDSVFEEALDFPHDCRIQIDKLKAGRKIRELDPDESGRLVLAAAERHVHSLLSGMNLSAAGAWQLRYTIGEVAESLLGVKHALSRNASMDLLLYLSIRTGSDYGRYESLINQMIDQVEQDIERQPLTMGERYVLSLVRSSVIAGPMLGKTSPMVSRLTSLIGDGAVFCLAPGEFWADAINENFSNMPAAERQQYALLFIHLRSATASRPTKKWLKTAEKLIVGLDEKKLREQLLAWLPLVSKGRSISRLSGFVGDVRGLADTMHDENATILRGLLWTIPTLQNSDQFARLIGAVAISAYKKVPGVGPRAVKVGNAAVYSLSQLSPEAAVSQLAMLKVRVKFGTAQKEIEKAYSVAAESLGLPREEIEEMGIPSYGLEGVGHLVEQFGEYRVELSVTGANAQVKWFDAKGKLLKSTPSKVKNEHKQECAELHQSLKDIQGMLPAQRDRIDAMFLLRKSWPIEIWRERYLEHPLVGTIASRMIWCIDQIPVLFIDGQATNLDGQEIEFGTTAEVTLWHPVERTIDEIISWRQRLEKLALTQPFKQAHREVYLLTDAERNTQTYSNRYAAHIIRQHQFNALCAARGWKNRLRLMVDDTYLPPYKELPKWGLRAEFWVEGIGDNFGTDTNESGVYLRLATDQVRFYQIGSASNSVHASP
jgi:hypothetical protein